MHYLINASVENGGILPNYVHWSGLEAYQMEVPMTKLFW